MNSNLFNLNLKDVAGAILSAVIVGALGYLQSVASIYEIDLNALLNIVVLTGITSLLKSIGTDSDGKFLGNVKVK